MTDRELMQQALDALEEAQDYTSCPTFSPSMTQQCAVAAVALRARLAQPNDFNPDWDAMAVMVEEQQRMAKRIEELKERLLQVELNSSLARLAQPEPEWQGLTDEERAEAWAKTKGDLFLRVPPFSLAIEAKLKEKNAA